MSLLSAESVEENGAVPVPLAVKLVVNVVPLRTMVMRWTLLLRRVTLTSNVEFSSGGKVPLRPVSVSPLRNQYPGEPLVLHVVNPKRLVPDAPRRRPLVPENPPGESFTENVRFVCSAPPANGRVAEAEPPLCP